jgi:molybdenum cofactor biosynthesis enzyme
MEFDNSFTVQKPIDEVWNTMIDLERVVPAVPGARVACAMAALTVYDIVKGIERGVEIERLALQEKSGGRSGEWHSEAGGDGERSGGS